MAEMPRRAAFTRSTCWAREGKKRGAAFKMVSSSSQQGGRDNRTEGVPAYGRKIHPFPPCLCAILVASSLLSVLNRPLFFFFAPPERGKEGMVAMPLPWPFYACLHRHPKLARAQDGRTSHVIRKGGYPLVHSCVSWVCSKRK